MEKQVPLNIPVAPTTPREGLKALTVAGSAYPARHSISFLPPGILITRFKL
jgi:hypothetical protein